MALHLCDVSNLLGGGGICLWLLIVLPQEKGSLLGQHTSKISVDAAALFMGIASSLQTLLKIS